MTTLVCKYVQLIADGWIGIRFSNATRKVIGLLADCEGFCMTVSERRIRLISIHDLLKARGVSRPIFSGFDFRENPSCARHPETGHYAGHIVLVGTRKYRRNARVWNPSGRA
jgi:hypothetical protein